MTRSSSRRALEPPQGETGVTRAGQTDTKGKSSKPMIDSGKKSNLHDAQASIIRNWNIPTGKTMGVKNCVTPDRWPQNNTDADLWHGEILMLLLQASELSRGDNKLFQEQLGAVIKERQERNRSAKGKTPGMTVPDLKRVCQRLEELAKDGQGAKEEPEQQDTEIDPARRSRSSGKPLEETEREATKATKKDNAQQKPTSKRNTRNSKPNEHPTTSTVPDPETNKRPTRQGRSQPKALDKDHHAPKPAPKRTASDLPLRPARKTRTTKSPKLKSPDSKPPIQVPVTPANPPEPSDSEAEEDEEPAAPPEPVSGRHIYGTYIPPTLISFDPPESTVAAQAGTQTRQTRSRKRARADEEEAREEGPVEVQIDSDPRDIDATGFLSELDPKEAQQRRKRKVRLSRLEAEPVAEPAWSQDLPAPDNSLLDGVEADNRHDEVFEKGEAVSSPARQEAVNGVAMSEERNGLEQGEMALEMLLELLPRIPSNATQDEQSLLEDRIALLRRDVSDYCVGH